MNDADKDLLKDADKDPYLRGRSWEPPGSTEPALLDGALRYDQKSWCAILRIYGPMIYRRACKKISDKELARDLAQDVFREASQKLGTFLEQPPGHPGFRAWLFKILYNKVGDQLRRDRKDPLRSAVDVGTQQVGEWPDGIPQDDGEQGAGEESEVLRRALEVVETEFQLRTREAFRLVEIEGKSVDEVAQALGMTKPAVYVAKSKIKGRLRRLLKGLGEPLGS